MKGYVYILQSDKNASYYIGSTTDLNRRLTEHNRGNTPATKYLIPLRLVFSQEYETLEVARTIELRLKKLKRRDYIEAVIRDGHIRISC